MQADVEPTSRGEGAGSSTGQPHDEQCRSIDDARVFIDRGPRVANEGDQLPVRGERRLQPTPEQSIAAAVSTQQMHLSCTLHDQRPAIRCPLRRLARWIVRDSDRTDVHDDVTVGRVCKVLAVRRPRRRLPFGINAPELVVPNHEAARAVHDLERERALLLCVADLRCSRREAPQGRRPRSDPSRRSLTRGGNWECETALSRFPQCENDR